MHIIDKRLRAEQFRHRLGQALQNAGMTQSDLARATRINRSTVSQLLSGTATRLPNAQVIGACAAALRVSADWLLSLSDRPESAADLLADALSLTTAARALIDEQIFAWHKEAEGFKIRHVPATLPDMFKTPEMLEWEYTPHLGRTSQQAINASNDRLTWMRRSASDYEIALPVYELVSFARAEGYYRGIPHQLRVAQIDHFVTLCEQFYPRVPHLSVRFQNAVFCTADHFRPTAQRAVCRYAKCGLSRPRPDPSFYQAFRHIGHTGNRQRPRSERASATVATADCLTPKGQKNSKSQISAAQVQTQHQQKASRDQLRARFGRVTGITVRALR